MGPILRHLPRRNRIRMDIVSQGMDMDTETPEMELPEIPAWMRNTKRTRSSRGKDLAGLPGSRRVFALVNGNLSRSWRILSRNIALLVSMRRLMRVRFTILWRKRRRSFWIIFKEEVIILIPLRCPRRIKAMASRLRILKTGK